MESLYSVNFPQTMNLMFLQNTIFDGSFIDVLSSFLIMSVNLIQQTTTATNVVAPTILFNHSVKMTLKLQTRDSITVNALNWMIQPHADTSVSFPAQPVIVSMKDNLNIQTLQMTSVQFGLNLPATNGIAVSPFVYNAATTATVTLI